MIEISAWLTAIIFNEGFTPILKIYECINVSVGNNAAKFANNRDHIRLSKAKRRSTELA